MFIIVGGSSRSGTSSIATFLHLHNEITMCRTMDQIRHTSMEQMCEQCRAVLRGGRDVLQLVLFKDRENQQDIWSTYVRKKNEGLLNGHCTEHIGVRWDYAEWSNTNLRGATRKGEAKLVFSMRNLKDLFTSLSFNGFLGKGNVEAQMREFQAKTTRSIDSMNKLKDKACPVASCNGEDLRRLMDWLGLEMNSLQKSWVDTPPVTNDTRKPGYKEHKEKIADRIKIPVEIEKRYWALRDNARASYCK